MDQVAYNKTRNFNRGAITRFASYWTSASWETQPKSSEGGHILKLSNFKKKEIAAPYGMRCACISGTSA